MAVMQNSIIFGGIDSADFGIYIGGEGTFDAPKRDVEMISIPGRNGAFALDKGRFENIEVTYSAFNHEPDLETFSAQLEGFRNAICSQKGYQRLTDTFHPDEYRMAAYIDGLEIKPIDYNTAATFDIKFNCKPQRYLTSGEEAIDVDSGDVVTNPTLFESSPMLEVEGYGEISINDEKVTVENAQLGEIKISDSATTASVLLTVDNLNAGDSITKKVNTEPYIDTIISFPSGSVNSCSATMRSAGTGGTVTVSRITTNSYRIRMAPTVAGFINGTSATATAEALVTIQPSSTSYSKVLYVSASYDASTNSIILSASFDSAWPSGFSYSFEYKHPAYYGISSKIVMPDVMYIDLDIGEAYGYIDGELLTFNNTVQMPAELPTLKTGGNTMIYEGTVTNLKVIPRWWKI